MLFWLGLVGLRCCFGLVSMLGLGLVWLCRCGLMRLLCFGLVAVLARLGCRFGLAWLLFWLGLLVMLRSLRLLCVDLVWLLFWFGVVALSWFGVFVLLWFGVASVFVRFGCCLELVWLLSWFGVVVLI